MHQSIYYPSKVLAPFISHYVIMKAEKENKTLTYQDFPRTAMDMVFLFEGTIEVNPSKADSFLLNPYEFIGLFDVPYQVHLNDIYGLHVRFKPNGIYPLTKIPLQQFLNSHLSLIDLVGNTIKELSEQMGNCSIDQEKINLFESWLMPFYQRDRFHYRIEQGLKLIETHQGLITVKQLSEQLNTNYKTLDRWFYKNIGVNPKTYIQMSRFKYMLAHLDQQQNMDWMQLVNDFQFHDQAHFIKFFKRYSGFTPSSYYSQNSSFDFSL